MSEAGGAELPVRFLFGAIISVEGTRMDQNRRELMKAKNVFAGAFYEGRCLGFYREALCCNHAAVSLCAAANRDHNCNWGWGLGT